MGAFDVFVVPSRWEGFGRVAVEAMLAGVPVIASDVGGLPEVVGDAGILTPVDDPVALAAATERLIESPALRADLGERGRERARRRFGKKRMLQEVGAVYEKMIRSLCGPHATRPPGR